MDRCLLYYSALHINEKVLLLWAFSSMWYLITCTGVSVAVGIPLTWVEDSCCDQVKVEITLLYKHIIFSHFLKAQRNHPVMTCVQLWVWLMYYPSSHLLCIPVLWALLQHTHLPEEKVNFRKWSGWDSHYDHRGQGNKVMYWYCFYKEQTTCGIEMITSVFPNEETDTMWTRLVWKDSVSFLRQNNEFHNLLN